MTEIDTLTRQSEPVDIAVDGQGAVWFSQARANRIGRYADGQFQEYPVTVPSAALTGLAVAPDGSIWFAMTRAGKLGRLRDGQITEVSLPRDGARPISLAVDGTGRVWYADIRGRVGSIAPDRAGR
jgi:virginiamycin B lyase